MDKAILFDLAKRWWKWVLIISLLIIIYFLANRTVVLEQKVQDALNEAKTNRDRSIFYKSIYDNLIIEEDNLRFKYDSLVLEKDKIKIEYHEKIKLVNKYTVSDMQRYFDERTK